MTDYTARSIPHQAGVRSRWKPHSSCGGGDSILNKSVQSTAAHGQIIRETVTKGMNQ
jgi:hypothetical protein